MAKGKKWPEADNAIVRDNYGVIGPAATSKLLPHRTFTAVQMAAARLGVRAPVRRHGKTIRGRKYVTVEMRKFDDTALREALHAAPVIVVHGARYVDLESRLDRYPTDCMSPGPAG